MRRRTSFAVLVLFALGIGVSLAPITVPYNDVNLTTSDVTTNNASTSKHGFLKKLSGVSTEFMNGAGNWATPAGGGSGSPGGSDGQIQFNNSGAFGGLGAWNGSLLDLGSADFATTGIIAGGTTDSDDILLRPNYGKIANVDITLGVRPGSTDHNQTLLNITAERDGTTSYFNPTIEFKTTTGSPGYIAQSLYSFGTEGTQNSDGTLNNDHYWYLYDYVNSDTPILYSTVNNTWNFYKQATFHGQPILDMPSLYGGTAAGSSLTLYSTSGAGSGDAIYAKVGNNGSITRATFNQTGVDLTGTVTVNSVAAATKVTGTSTIDFGSIADGACLQSTYTLSGAATGDYVAAQRPSSLADGVELTAWVSATNTVKIQVCNLSGGAVDPASATYGVALVR